MGSATHREPLVIEGVEVVPLCDAVGEMAGSLRLPVEETFLGGTAQDWAGLSPLAWVLHFHCYLLRSPGGRIVLVDTGIGGANSPAAVWAPVPGRLLDELVRVGVGPEDVDCVVLTHLHSDHSSGAVLNGVPAFPNARYVLQQAELSAATAAIHQTVVEPLRDNLHVMDGSATVAPGVSIVPTPGHTLGHQSIGVGDLVISGDVVLHPVQLRNPAITYVYDDDPALAAQTRRNLLDDLRRRGGSIATGHFAEPFIRL